VEVLTLGSGEKQGKAECTAGPKSIPGSRLEVAGRERPVLSLVPVVHGPLSDVSVLGPHHENAI
jgi:hypothetical protein